MSAAFEQPAIALPRPNHSMHVLLTRRDPMTPSLFDSLS
jgi:hypothetical protein